MATPRTIATLDRVGNALPLDFANTVHSRFESDSREYLTSYADVLVWARDGGLLTAAQYRALRGVSDRHPRRAAAMYRRILELREVVYRLFLSIASGGAPRAGDVSLLNRWLGDVLAHRRVRGTGAGYEWSWDDDELPLDRPVWPVVLAAAELMASDDRHRVKECPSPDGCGWLFLDRSKNGSRRWCDMRQCGNIAKARRHYRKHGRRKTA